MQSSFLLKGNELIKKIRYLAFLQDLKIIKKFLLKYPHVQSIKQVGRESFTKRRYSKDSELNVNKTIKQQFNHLRINDNKFYPSFFYLKNKKYIIKIFDEKD